jgi:hypothetical protein
MGSGLLRQMTDKVKAVNTQEQVAEAAGELAGNILVPACDTVAGKAVFKGELVIDKNDKLGQGLGKSPAGPGCCRCIGMCC